MKSSLTVRWANFWNCTIHARSLMRMVHENICSWKHDISQGPSRLARDYCCWRLAAFDSKLLPRWKLQLRSATECIHRDFSYELEQFSKAQDPQAAPDERIALDLDIEYLNNFFEAVERAIYICSYGACFCCLMDAPAHPLRCGHALCNACIKAYAIYARSMVTLTFCPFH
ncbi:hypothetical protein M433DRAFT_145585 [Acidomyces richmondensis BFW]|nr:MAG: hypothetical protein FE78DRAFT_80443 [Acidomyces sp. 'richmondensis']KYG43714.1 hypothetical protein M433DRAFT_145585 [Acidomyces richmondensis BFW]